MSQNLIKEQLPTSFEEDFSNAEIEKISQGQLMNLTKIIPENILEQTKIREVISREEDERPQHSFFLHIFRLYSKVRLIYKSGSNNYSLYYLLAE
jgi:hypothetical protein